MGMGSEGAEDEEEIIAIPIEDWIDLHTFLPRDIPPLLEHFAEVH